MWFGEEVQELLWKEHINSRLHSFGTAEKLIEKVRFVNKNIKMWTKSIGNKGMQTLKIC